MAILLTLLKWLFVAIIMPFVWAGLLHKWGENKLGDNSWRVYPFYLFLFGYFTNHWFFGGESIGVDDYVKFAIILAAAIVLHVILKRAWRSHPTP